MSIEIFDNNFTALSNYMTSNKKIESGLLNELSIFIVHQIVKNFSEKIGSKKTLLTNLIKQYLNSLKIELSSIQICEFCSYCINTLEKITSYHYNISDFFFFLSETTLSDNENFTSINFSNYQTDNKYNGIVPNKIAYLSNNYTDEAYKLFSLNQSINCTAVSVNTFLSACEEVCYGRADYCIVPISVSNEGIIGGFYRHILRYELKIIQCCDILSTDGENYTRYALLQRGFDNIYNENIKYFEILLSFTESTQSKEYLNIQKNKELNLTDFLCAAEFVSANILRINSIPISYSSDKLGYDILLDIEHADFPALLMFLEVTAPDYTVIGMYRCIQ